MAVLYVDVSHHDWSRRGGNLGWDKIRASTSACMIARATYGDPDGWHRSSSHHLDFHRAAKAAGFDLRGSYHNLTRGDASSIRRQVDWLRREMDEAGAVWAMADVERYPEMMSAGMFPRWSDVRRFHDTWYAKESRVMAWYLPQWVWSRSDMGSPDLSTLRGPLVSSRYPLSYMREVPADLYRRAGGDGGPGWSSYGGKRPALWQFTSSALVPGTTGGADCNAFRGTYDGLRSLLHPSSSIQQEDDVIDPTDIAKIAAAAADQVWGRLIGSPALDVDPRPAADWLKAGTAAERKIDALRTLLEQHASGQLSADAVVDELARRIAGAQ